MVMTLEARSEELSTLTKCAPEKDIVSGEGLGEGAIDAMAACYSLDCFSCHSADCYSCVSCYSSR